MRGEKNKIIGTSDFNRLLKSLHKFSVFHVPKFAPDMTDVCLKNFLREKLDINCCFSISEERCGFN